MLVTCKCLNITIESKGYVTKEIDISQLTEAERANPFFNEPLVMTIEIQGITKEQSGVVDVQNIGPYVVHRCCNCSTYTHAVHRELGASLILVNQNLISSEEDVEKLKNSPGYSEVFRIVINTPAPNAERNIRPPNKFIVSQLPPNTRMALGGLEKLMDEAILRKTSAIEEKIRVYTSQQYQILDEFRERAHTEHALLARLLCEEQSNKSINSREAAPRILKHSLSNVVNSDEDSETKGKSTSPRRNSTAKVRIVNGKSKKANVQQHFDHEGLFMLEGMDDVANGTKQVSEEESDTDDSGNDEGIHIPRNQRGGYPALAKSLPVNVPAFRTLGRQIVPIDYEPVSRDPIDPHNIRASIKALAKSVHGDTVFGDLPRPRFSTQI